MRTLLVAGIIAGSYSPLAISQTERDLDSHEHGAAVLTMVIEPNAIYLDLQSPWINLVGFEHAPSTDADRQAVDQVIDTLANPQALFVFAPGNCTGELTEMDAGMPGVETADAHAHGDAHADEDEHAHEEEHAHADEDEHAHEEEHAHADEDEHAHEEEHAHADEDEHAHEEEHAHADEDEHASEDEHAHDDHAHDDAETHSEVLASYRFVCEEGAKPTTFTAALMQRFPGIEALQVEFVGPGGQSAASLTAGSSADVSLEPVL